MEFGEAIKSFGGNDRTVAKHAQYSLHVVRDGIGWFCCFRLSFVVGLLIAIVLLRSIKDLIGYPIDAVDGKVGKVEDAFFDDWYWRLRYVVADTGTWLPGKKVLLSPAHLNRNGS